MRTSALLLLAVLFCGACVAADQPPATSDLQVLVALISPESSPITTKFSGSKLQFLPRTDAVCLKLRTYIVQRVDPRSDVTRLRRYSTCQPAWKFETRNAVQHEKQPDDLNWFY